MRFACCFTFLSYLIIPLLLKSQSAADSTILSLQKKNAIALYYQSLQTQSGLYNGIEYIRYETTLKDGHQYFDTAKAVPGSVFYDGMLYTDVPMLYDIVKDQLVAQHYNNVFFMQLIKSKVDSFNFIGHAFVHLAKDSTKKENISEGFYDLLYNGKIKLYAKRYKTIQESIPDMVVERRVYMHNRYFVFKNNTYNEVFSESSVYNLFNDKRSELRQALRKQHIRFRKQREYAIKMMVEQYDALTP